MSDAISFESDGIGSMKPVFTGDPTSANGVGGQLQFDRLALFTSGPMYWRASNLTPREHTERLMDLFQWCLGLPEVMVGINPIGIAQLITSIMLNPNRTNRPVADEDIHKLGDFMFSIENAPLWEFDEKVWNLDKLFDWLRRCETNKLLWLRADEIGWWVEATKQSLLIYSQFNSSSIDPTLLLTLLARHSCMLFGPYNDSTVRARLVALALARGREDIAESVSEATFTDPRIASVCWSWNLLSFGNVGSRNLIWSPDFSLWSDWPLSAAWAPERPPSHPPSAPFSAREAAEFLDDTLWTTIETYFSTARRAVGLGVAAPTVAGRQTRPPVFYFASPTTPPTQPEDYLNNRASAIQPLTEKCLLAQDPVSSQIGWGVLQGRVVAIRSESVGDENYSLWYLLLPTLAKTSSPAQIEEVARSVVSQLSYLEFSIDHEARDISTDLDEYQNRSALYTGSLDAVGNVIADALDLIPTVSRRSVTKINESATQLLRLMLRMQTNAEKGQSDTIQLQAKYQAYIDGTEDYFRRRITFSPLANEWLRSLPDAVLHAYPYTYIAQPLTSHATNMDEARSQIERSIGALKVFIEQADLHARAQLTRWGALIGSLIVIATLLGTFAQIFSGGSGNTPSSGSSQPIISTNLAMLESILQIAGILALAVIVTMAVVFGFVLLSRFLPSIPPRFVSHMVRYRRYIDQAVLVVSGRTPETEQQAGSSLEQVDSKATEVLGNLWKILEEIARPTRGRAFKRWHRRERRVEYSIQLFDLSPDTIPLPRTLCILRFKSGELRTYSMISDWEWVAFLGVARIGGDLAEQLDKWLSAPVIAEQIRRMDVATFARVLKEHGVSADPKLLTPDKWTGNLV